MPLAPVPASARVTRPPVVLSKTEAPLPMSEVRPNQARVLTEIAMS